MLRSMLPPGELQKPAFEDLSGDNQEYADAGRILATARRQFKPALIFMLVGVVLAGAFLVLATRRYTAEAQLLIDETKGKTSDSSQAAADPTASDTMILSQVELIHSTRMALQVVDKLDLTHNDAFMADRSSPITLITRPLRALLVSMNVLPQPKDLPVDLRRVAAEHLQEDLTVDRTGRTFAMSLTYTSKDPVFAARVANGFADAYLNDGLESNFDTVQRTSVWLQGRLHELQTESSQADLAVQKFRGEHGLIASDGKLVSEQQLSELNSQLVLAQADSARARARTEEFDQLLKAGTPNAVLNAAVATGALDDSVVGKLKVRYLDATSHLSDVVKRWGPQHVEAVRIQAEVTDIQSQLVAELDRFAKSYANDLAVAQSREISLRKGLEQVVGTNDANNQTQVELRALQQKADAYRDLYQTFLQRNQQALQEKSFPIQAARVISEADVPTDPSAPNVRLVLALGAVLGLSLGAGFGAMREFRDKFFRTAGQIRAELGIKCLGIIPSITRGDLAHAPGAPERRDGLRARLMTYVVDNPLSAMAETMRRAKIAADMTLPDLQPKIIGIVSVLPKEGKSTISANFARLLASQGARTLLIDADLRGLGLTKSLKPDATAGILEVLLDGASLQETAQVESGLRLAFLPAVKRQKAAHTADILASRRMQEFLADAGRSFDYVIVDLPPLAPVADAKALAAHLDATVLVVGWGQTARKIVQSTIGAEPEVMAKCLGVVLNNADMKRMKLYSDYGSEEYYYKSYASYYSKG